MVVYYWLCSFTVFFLLFLRSSLALTYSTQKRRKESCRISFYVGTGLRSLEAMQSRRKFLGRIRQGWDKRIRLNTVEITISVFTSPWRKTTENLSENSRCQGSIRTSQMRSVVVTTQPRISVTLRVVPIESLSLQARCWVDWMTIGARAAEQQTPGGPFYEYQFSAAFVGSWWCSRDLRTKDGDEQGRKPKTRKRLRATVELGSAATEKAHSNSILACKFRFGKMTSVDVRNDRR